MQHAKKSPRLDITCTHPGNNIVNRRQRFPHSNRWPVTQWWKIWLVRGRIHDLNEYDNTRTTIDTAAHTCRQRRGSLPRRYRPSSHRSSATHMFCPTAPQYTVSTLFYSKERGRVVYSVATDSISSIGG
ncbi:unnamed protein product [Ectocarpus sp. 13 AM-2016]